MAGALESRDPFGRAYVRLRRDLSVGGRAPGTQVRVDETARELKISPTPVREALARLAGERLVQECRRRGYFIPRYSGSELAQLYAMTQACLLTTLALVGPPDGRPSAPRVPEVKGDVRPAGLFAQLLAQSRLAMLFDCGALLVDRLAPFAAAEATLFDTGAEVASLTALLDSWDLRGLESAVRDHFESRRAKADRIVSVATDRSGASNIFGI